MKNKKLERKRIMAELTRKDILDSAVSILLKKGQKGLSMDQVAAGANIAKGTVYLYFQSKQVLLDSVVDYCFAPLGKEFIVIVESALPPIEKLRKCLWRSIENAEKNKQLYMELKNIIFNSRDKDVSDKKSYYWINAKLFASVLDEGAQSGILKPVNSLKVGALFFDSICCLMSFRILLNPSETIEEDVNELMNLYLSGLAVL